MRPKNYTIKQNKCMISGSERLEQFLDLGAQPNGNNFPDEKTKNKEITYPMSMSVCLDSWLVQINDYPPPEVVFTDHPYITGVNVPVVNHFKQLSKHIIKKFELPPQSLVLDIGANDGTFLDCFRENGMRTMGVDPGQRTGKLAKARGITVCETFWNRATGQSLRSLNLAPRLITATAVFYHVPNLHEFVAGLVEVMDDQTIFAAQCVYLKSVIEELQFDHFYHEHTCIYSLKPLQQLFTEHKMRIIDVEFYDIHGGSFVIYIAKATSPLPTSQRVEAAIVEEEKAGLFKIETYREFARKVKSNCGNLVQLLRELRRDQKSVFALGAPLKGSTLLNYCKIGPELVQKAVEVNQFKIGRLTPGTHIPIISEDQVTDQPDYYLVLAWNFLDHFIQTHQKYLLAGGKFIVPNPKVGIVDAEGFHPWEKRQ